MPSKAYKNFGKNIDTVSRLQKTYNDIRQARHTKGKGAFDHITRSAILFLVSSFEVYCEEVLYECCEKLINTAKKGSALPTEVQKTINAYTKNEKNAALPMSLCDDGWKKIYCDMVKKRTDALNTPNNHNLTDLFSSLVGVSDIKNIADIEKIDEIISFRGQITHRVKADSYVHIETVEEYREIVEKVVIDIDKKLCDHIKRKYKTKAPWNNTYEELK